MSVMAVDGWFLYDALFNVDLILLEKWKVLRKIEL